jgi:hypothetical protein
VRRPGTGVARRSGFRGIGGGAVAPDEGGGEEAQTIEPGAIASTSAVASPTLAHPDYIFRFSAGTFARSTEGSYDDLTTGLRTWWSANVLRTPAGLVAPNGAPYRLFEGARTNRIVQSEALGTSPWTATNATVTADAGTAPDGDSDADQVAFTSTGGTVAQPLQTVPANDRSSRRPRGSSSRAAPVPCASRS